MNRSRGSAFLPGTLMVPLCAPLAFADGKVFRHSAAVVPMVDQEAVIAFKDGVEVLAIRTRADATGTDGEKLAWVVPVPGPGAPELLSTSQGTFDTARAVTQPHLQEHRDGGAGVYVLIIAVLLFLAAAVVRLNPGVSARERVIMALIIGVLTPPLCILTMLPALARSRSSGPAIPQTDVQLLASQRIGTLDVSVIRAVGGADGAAALSRWLEGAGCAVPARAEPVLARYAAEGWVFVAARLAGTSRGQRLEPTPLVLKFATPRPVYPMRLTGVDNGPLDLELCVLADGTAGAPGMRIERSSPLAAAGEQVQTADGAIPLSHAGLAGIAGLVGNPAWITRLSGRLAPAGQQSDMVLDVAGAARVNESLYTPGAATALAVDLGTAVAGLGVVTLAVALFFRSWTQGRTWVALLACLACGTLVAFATAVAVPQYVGEVRQTRSPQWVQSRAVRQMTSHAVADLADLRLEIAKWRAEGNGWFDQLPEEGDRPWGYQLLTDAKGEAWVVTYDGFGGESGRELIYGLGLEPARDSK